MAFDPYSDENLFGTLGGGGSPAPTPEEDQAWDAFRNAMDQGPETDPYSDQNLYDTLVPPEESYEDFVARTTAEQQGEAGLPSIEDRKAQAVASGDIAGYDDLLALEDTPEQGASVGGLQGEITEAPQAPEQGYANEAVPVTELDRRSTLTEEEKALEDVKWAEDRERNEREHPVIIRC